VTGSLDAPVTAVIADAAGMTVAQRREHRYWEVTMTEKTEKTEKTPNAESEVKAEDERAAIRKAIDETEAPTRAEVKQPAKKPDVNAPAPGGDRKRREGSPPAK
jgi:hypothetical protein